MRSFLQLERQVCVPLADLWRVPKQAKWGLHIDRDRETQLLFGEKVLVLKEQDEWNFIEASEQPKWTAEEGWHGYRGWVLKEQLASVVPAKMQDLAVVATPWAAVDNIDGLFLPLGAQFPVIQHNETSSVLLLPEGREGIVAMSTIRLLPVIAALSSADRQLIASVAVSLCGCPYFWGGRAPFRYPSLETPASFDCSGLVQVLFRLVGRHLPRNAIDQYKVCQLCAWHELQPADLIFSASATTPLRIDHVMLYLGDEQLAEATMSHACIRRASFADKWGNDWKSTLSASPSIVYCTKIEK